MRSGVVIIGYSGHSYVVADSIEDMELRIIGYCDKEKKIHNPFGFHYLGDEDSELAKEKLTQSFFFIAIGDNKIREKVFHKLSAHPNYRSIYHCNPTAFISKHADIGICTFVAPNATVNAFAKIGEGVICNTGCIIEHECKIGHFAHIAPGAVLAGNVSVGERSFIGANSVVKQGIKIGKDVIVGAGSVVLKDIPDGVTVVGNPVRII